MKRKKRALVAGAGGFIGGHLITQLKKEGYFVRGVDIKKPEFVKTDADEFLLKDLRIAKNCAKALDIKGGFDEVYQLAADRGGAGYMEPKAALMMHDNVLINANMINAAVESKVKKYFFSSSVCVYKDMPFGSHKLPEAKAYPAEPANDYGWEKLYSERLIQAYARTYPIDIRIARFQTTYGPHGTWEGLKPKAPDDFCRKAAMAKDGGFVEVWGNGKQIRSFTFIDDQIDAIRALMKSKIDTPANTGSDQYVEVNDLAKAAIKASGKNLKIKYVDGPTGKELGFDPKKLSKDFYKGVKSRKIDQKLIFSTGWHWKYPLEEGVKIHYKWIEEQVEKKYGKKRKPLKK